MERKQNTGLWSIRLLFIAFCCMVLFIACDNIFLRIDNSMESKLQGKWRMEFADTVFFNFQNKLFQYQIYNPLESRFDYTFGYYGLSGDTTINIEILLNGAYIPFGELRWDTVPDLNDSNVRKIVKPFLIKELTDGSLILSSEGNNFSFWRF
ncbi:MAG: hypothetical protein LBS54_08000 [Dysgonamonadaceae bacterium]|jgi:hypothetical protein|nr:hypothetical protein [Dysgonamonadaceae bacterium]